MSGLRVVKTLRRDGRNREKTDIEGCGKIWGDFV